MNIIIRTRKLPSITIVFISVCPLKPIQLQYQGKHQGYKEILKKYIKKISNDIFFKMYF